MGGENKVELMRLYRKQKHKKDTHSFSLGLRLLLGTINVALYQTKQRKSYEHATEHFQASCIRENRAGAPPCRAHGKGAYHRRSLLKPQSSAAAAYPRASIYYVRV